MLGQNGCGKTTWIREFARISTVSVSVKPQRIVATFDGTVEELFNTKIRSMYSNEYFRLNVVRHLGIDRLLDHPVKVLSGGELQRVAICLSLGKVADVYLIDEPSAFLDCEQRVNVAYVIRKFIYETKRTAFVVEHDLNMCLYLADRVIIFEGKPGIEATATSPMEFITGMNLFLKSIELTLRTDSENGRPRINKFLGSKDREQKKSGVFFNTSY